MRITNGAYIIDSLGKILLTHPTNHPMTVWSVPKGLGEPKETSKESAIRETLEETNLDLSLYKDATTYTNLGIVNYAHKKKRLHAHLFLIGLPLSDLDMDLTCRSMFICDHTGFELPENDITKWVDIDFARDFLHYSQKNILKKVDKLLASDILK